MPPHTRVHQALTANVEKRVLLGLAARAPRWLTSDQLTLLAVLSQLAAGVFYALSRYRPLALLLVCACIALNWLGDSLDGTLARHRNQLRPRYGFYVDHIADCFGTLALLTGLAASGFAHPLVALSMLLAFLLLAAESYLAAHTLARFQLSQGPFGPTELRLLLIAANLTLLHSPYVTLLGHRLLLFDLGGTIGAAAMFATALLVTARHTAQLFREEPLPACVPSPNRVPHDHRSKAKVIVGGRKNLTPGSFHEAPRDVQDQTQVIAGNTFSAAIAHSHASPTSTLQPLFLHPAQPPLLSSLSLHTQEPAQ